MPGLTCVKDGNAVLPISFQDSRLRVLVARAIFGDANFTRYAQQALPPIPIVAENGHARLEGAVVNRFR